MKKTSKLTLKRETIVALDDAAMSNVKGGFTYALSMGATCKHSKELTANNAHDCGLADGRLKCLQK
jgi:natural product precursor